AEEARRGRATLASAKAQVDWAEKNLDRLEELLKNSVVAAAEVDKARADRDDAVARRDAAEQALALLEKGSRHEEVTAAREAATAARAQLAALRSRQGELVLVAPARGVVLLRNFEAGELVQPGQPVMTLGDPEKL